jgi:hypothetical protein
VLTSSFAFLLSLTFFLLVQKESNKEKRHFLSNRSAGQEDAMRCFRSSLIIYMALVVSLALNKGAIMGWALFLL